MIENELRNQNGLGDDLSRNVGCLSLPEQEFIQNGAARRITHSEGDKRQSYDEEGSRSSKEIRQYCSYCSKDTSPGFSSYSSFDPYKLKRNNTDKTISTCVSSNKSNPNRYSNNTICSHCYNLNLRNSSQVNSYFSHLNIFSAQSPSDVSPLDSAILTSNQIQHLQLNKTTSGESFLKQYHPNFSLDNSERDSIPLANGIDLQKSPINLDKYNYGNSLQTNGNNNKTNQIKQLNSESSYDHFCNQTPQCQCIYCAGYINNNLHRIKEEAESDTYSMRSFSFRQRQTQIEQIDENRKVSENTLIQSKIMIARSQLRSQLQNDCSINSQKTLEHPSPKSESFQNINQQQQSNIQVEQNKNNQEDQQNNKFEENKVIQGDQINSLQQNSQDQFQQKEQSDKNTQQDENEKQIIENRQNTLLNQDKIVKDEVEQKQILHDNEFDESNPPQLYSSTQSFMKKNDFLFRQLSNEESYWNDFENNYENIKKIVVAFSSKLLERRTLANKFPIFQRIDENIPDKQSFAALSFANVQHRQSKNDLSQESSFFMNLNKINSQNASSHGGYEITPISQNKGSFLNTQSMSFTPTIKQCSQRFTLGSPTQYVSNLDNMIYHIFSTPQKTLTEVLKEMDNNEMICSEYLNKKIPGIIDIWKKKYVSLYLDRLCYQESKNSPINTISFKHFEIQIVKDNFKNTFALIDQNSEKKYTFRCNDDKENQFWVTTIADVIIFNQMYPKYKLYPENNPLYMKKQIVFPHEIQSTLFTGDLVFYREILILILQIYSKINRKTQKPEKKLEIAFIIRTQYMLQVCYHSEEEGILTYPFDTFMMLHNLARINRQLQLFYRVFIFPQNFSFRRMERSKETEDNKSDDHITSLCVSFISENSLKKFKDSNSLVYELLKICEIIKDKSPIKIINDKDIFETNKFNLHTQNYSYQNLIYLVLKQHINTVTNNPQLLNSIFKSSQLGLINENPSYNMPKTLIDGVSPNNSNINIPLNQSVRHFPNFSSLQSQDYSQDERNNSVCGSKLFGRFSYIEFGKDYLRNSLNPSTAKFM